MVERSFSSWHDSRVHDPRRLVLGSAQWGMPYGIANRSGPPEDAALEAMLARASRAGLRTIDTARAYGDSEPRIGRALARARGSEPWRVVTKLAPDVHEEGLDIAETLERVAASLARSREALALDALPVLLLHRFEHRHACAGKLWRALLAEREQGRIGMLGVSAATPEQAWAALDDPDIEALQVASSLLDLRLYRQDFFARARELGRTVYVRSVFLQGVAHLDPSTLPPALAPLAAPMRTIASAARALGVPRRSLYLAFARELLPGCQPVIGCETEEQLEQLIGDWASSAIGPNELGPLLAALPTLDATHVDPSRWPDARDASDAAKGGVGAAGGENASGSDQDARGRPANQTPTGSVATLPS